MGSTHACIKKGVAVVRHITQEFLRLLRDADGVTAMEYGLIAAAMTVTLASLMPGMGTTLSTMFSRVSTSL